MTFCIQKVTPKSHSPCHQSVYKRSRCDSELAGETLEGEWGDISDSGMSHLRPTMVTVDVGNDACKIQGWDDFSSHQISQHCPNVFRSELHWVDRANPWGDASYLSIPSGCKVLMLTKIYKSLQIENSCGKKQTFLKRPGGAETQFV